MPGLETARGAAVRGRIFYTTPVFCRRMRENTSVETLRRTSPCLLLAALWLVATPVRAVMVAGLYEARVPVTDQTSSGRSTALQQAFAAVLVKVTGNRAAASALTTMTGNPSHYMQQYRYEKVTDPTQPTVPPTQVLWAKFDPTVVGNALRAAHVPQWGVERPRTLVWLALGDLPGGRVLTAADNTYLMQALLTAAEQRGVALVFPQMDGPDRNAIGVPDLTGFNAERIHQASLRYKPDAVLVGSVTTFGTGQYAAHWELASADRIESWDTPAGDEVLVAVDGVQTSADRYATRYAVAPDAGLLDGVPLEIDNVTSLDAYAQVLSYLGSLTPVRAVHVERVAQGSLYLSVDVQGSLDNLESALVLGGSMTAVSAPVPTTGTTAPAATHAPPPGALPAEPLRYVYAPGP